MQQLNNRSGLLALITTVGLMQSSAALAQGPVSCSASQCEFTISSNLMLEAASSSVINLNHQSYQLGGTVTIVADGVRLPMTEADLTLNFGERPELFGTAVVPLDQTPGLENATFETLPRMAVGLAQGDTIETITGKDLPLNDGESYQQTSRNANQPYIFFHADAGLAMSYDFGQDYDILNNFVLAIPGSVSMTAVFDPTDPFIYLGYDKTEGLDLNGLKNRNGATVYEIKDENGNTTIEFIQKDNGELVENNLVTGESTTYQRDANGDYISLSGNGESLAGSQFDSSQGTRVEDIDADRNQDSDSQPDDSDKKQDDETSDFVDINAFGFSLNGWIPFEAQAEGLPQGVGDFSGQLALSGSIPMGYGIVLDGDVITYIGESGYAQGGNGDVVWGLPFLPDFISFDIELGAASVALEITDSAFSTYVSGELKPDMAFMQDFLPIMPAAGAKVLGYVNGDTGETSVAIEGDMAMGADTLGNWIGLDLSELQLTTARMEMSNTGFKVDGKTGIQIHPAIDIDSEVSVHASSDWLAPENTVLRMQGDMNIYGVALEDVTVELSRDGMFVNGAFVTPLTRIAMWGEVGAQGAQLSGLGSIALDLGDIADAMETAQNALAAAQREVARIESAISAMRGIISEEREKQAAALAKATDAVSIAQAAVNSLNSKIAAEYSAISSRKNQISSWYRWYKAAKWYEKASRYSRYVYEKSWRNADIARRYTVITAYKASLVVSNAALSTAKAALQLLQQAAETFPIDADPRMLSLQATKLVADGALEIAQIPFAAFPAIDGDLTGDITLSLGTQGIDGDVSAEYNGYTLAQGSLEFTPSFAACITLPVFGEACTRL